MTDLEKFIDTYKQFGIEVKTYKEDDKIKINLNGWLGDDNTHTKSDKFEGCLCFFSILEFTEEGEFLTQSFWE